MLLLAPLLVTQLVHCNQGYEAGLGSVLRLFEVSVSHGRQNRTLQKCAIVGALWIVKSWAMSAGTCSYT
jgi:hypothetical protein